MFRKLSLALAVSTALLPIGVFALGLGDIDTKSALNESFKAEIQLLSVAPGELDGIKAELASPTAFIKAGLERPFLLSKLRFKPVELESGEYVIQVSTQAPVREPFLNFLVEVNWPKGRLLREFTVLLDPPVTTGRKPPPIRMASVPVRDSVPSPQPSISAPAVAPSPTSEQIAAGNYYGPVPRGATLWSIAKSMAMPGATTEQVLTALYRLNPHAFIQNDINNLQAGVALLVPDSDEILSASPGQARSEFLELVRRGPDPSARVVRRPDPDHLRIASIPAESTAPPKAGSTATQGGEIDQVKTDLMMVRETSESTRQETQDLRSRIHELESQLDDIRQLLKLKNNELAQLQVSQQPGPETGDVLEEAPIAPQEWPSPPVESIPAEEATVAAETGAEETALPTLVEPPVEETASGEDALPFPVSEADRTVQEVDDTAVPDTLPVEPPVAEITDTETPAVETTAIQPPVAESPPIEAPKPKQPAPVVKAEVAEPELMDQVSELAGELMEDPVNLAAGGGGAVVLLGLFWWLLRRRHAAEDEFQESVLLTPDGGNTLELEEEAARDVVSNRTDGGDETSFISDFSPSDIDALQEETGEVDPAAEADVYIAYGRYQQAESLIAQALEKNPERLDLKLKLLEIYFTTRNIPAFTGMAQQMSDDGAEQGDPQLWARVQSMGREIAPGHDLFGGDSDFGDLEAKDGGLTGINEDSVSDSEALANLDLDMDTELSELSDGPVGGASDILHSDAGSVLEPPPVVEHDLSESSPLADPLSESSLAGTGESDFAFDLESLDDMNLGELDLDGDSTFKDVADTLEHDADEPEVSLQLPDEASQMDTGFEHDEEEVPVISMEELETLEDQGISETDSLFADDEDTPLSELLVSGNREEEIDTKLDLAKAYAEMGDAEGAREILDEVVEEGSEKQKSAAREVMEQLA